MNKIANGPVVVILSNAIAAVVEGNEAKAVKLTTDAITALSGQTPTKRAVARQAGVPAVKRSSTKVNAKRGPKPLLAPEQVAKMLSRKIRGEAVAVLAKEAGVSYQTAYRSINRLENKRTAKKSKAKRTRPTKRVATPVAA